MNSSLVLFLPVMATPAVEKLTLPTHHDDRGDLTVLELSDYVDWPVKRIYYVTNTVLPRGGHAVRGEKKLYIVMQGSCTGRFHDGSDWTEIKLAGPGDMVRMNTMCFREFVDFAPHTVLMAVSSVSYDRSLYIFDFDAFVREARTSA